MWNQCSPLPNKPFLYNGEWDSILNPYVLAWGVKVGTNSPIFLEEYDIVWPIKAYKEIKTISYALHFSGVLLGIEHIGSTSIHGQYSKNTIDIMVGVKSMDDFEDVQAALVEFGWVGKFGNKHTMRNNKWGFLSKNVGKQAYSLFITVHEGPQWELKLAFRDYMRAHPEEVKKLSKIKWDLKNSNCGFYHYTKGKEPFIMDVLERCGYSNEYYMETFSHIRGVIHANN